MLRKDPLSLEPLKSNRQLREHPALTLGAAVVGERRGVAAHGVEQVELAPELEMTCRVRIASLHHEGVTVRRRVEQVELAPGEATRHLRSARP